MNFSDPVTYIKITGILVLLLSIYLVPNADKLKKNQKKFFFIILVIPIIFSSLFLAGHTIYENITSVTKGPIHWHADYQVWACGQRLHLHKPEGFLNNKQGSPLYHSHEDDRIHIEGTINDLKEVTLSKYFEVTKGSLLDDSISIYTDDGLKTYVNGQNCPDGSKGYLKVYVNGKIISNWQNYVIKPHEYVPPGDCIIFEFSNFASETTDKICESYTAKGVEYS